MGGKFKANLFLGRRRRVVDAAAPSFFFGPQEWEKIPSPVRFLPFHIARGKNKIKKPPPSFLVHKRPPKKAKTGEGSRGERISIPKYHLQRDLYIRRCKVSFAIKISFLFLLLFPHSPPLSFGGVRSIYFHFAVWSEGERRFCVLRH